MNKHFVSLYIRMSVILVWMSCIQAVDDNIHIPPEYSNCSCRWTDWMNSDDASDGHDEESFRALRDKGYEFCNEPVDIQCFNNVANKLIDPKKTFGITCSIDIGLKCDFFCDDYKIRVACCYCPPKPKGPKFHLVSEHGRGCLTVVGDSSVLSLVVPQSCDLSNPAQLWSWISTNQIKNEMKKQCIRVNGTETGSRIITANCDETDPKQRWDYDKSTKSLSEGLGYLSARNGRYTNVASDSKWMANVEIGSTDLSTMQGFPCDKEPVAPSSGAVDCTFGSYQGSECHFSCDYGFKLPAGSRYPIVCMKNRQYNGTTPTCQEITCSPELLEPQDGALECTNQNRLDSSCIFSCDHGYHLDGGLRQSICLDSGRWDNLPPPRCTRVKCSPDLVEEGVVHGTVNCSNRQYMESSCFYFCGQGYDLKGSQRRYCTTSGQWSGSRPECIKIQCPALPELANGRITCSDDWNFMSSCQFSCDRGYTMVGSGSTSCTSFKTWGSSSPTCKRKTCSALSSPDNGFISCSDAYYFSSTCSFRCKDGYSVDADSTLQCTEEGWDHGSPECKRITCSPRLLSPISGNISCSEEEFFGSQCVFTCQKGYQVKGSNVVVCGTSGWSDSSPVCKKRHCPKFKQPANGKVTCHPGNEFEGFCFFSCDEGYVLSSTPEPVLCTHTGAWSGPAQRCKRIQCRKITSLRKGTVSCTDKNNFKSNCSFKCNDGFNLYGSPGAVCGVNGWDAQAPTCGRVLCTSLPQPANGQIVCSTRGRFSCIFSCNSGFRLIGYNVTTCQSDETWSNTNIPTCQRLRCGVADMRFLHGTVACTDEDLFGSVCNYTCKPGYEREGEQLTTCTDTGTWDQSPPTCKRVSCPGLPSLNHGTVTCTDSSYYASLCSLSCGRGYELIGSQSTQCQLDKTWSNRLPYCEQITCSPGFSNPSNGRVKCTERNNFASFCSFQCEPGFSLEGNNKTACSALGWSVTTAPSCRKITCPQSGDLFSDGTESCTRSDEHDSDCTYQCHEGYELVGFHKRRCTDAGKWSNQKPICNRIRCPEIGAAPNMETLCLEGSEYNSECVFLCRDGFRRVGTSKAVCTVKKIWQPSKMPYCELIPTIVPATNASVTLLVTQPTSSKNSLTHRNTIKTPTNEVGGITSTKTTPVSTTNSPINKNTESTSNKNSPASGGIPIIPIIVGGVAALIVILVVILIARCRRNKKPRFSKGIAMQESGYDDSQFQKLIPNGNSNRRFQSIPLDRLESEFTRKHADDDKLFREEFSSLLDGHGSREQGGKVANKEKNRYTNIIPYDHSRVVLPKGNGDSDYINASFVDGYKHKGKFIAAQGPKESTINDFWRMVWDQNVATIIMVTNLVEGKESKCSQYWPLSGSQLYGDLSVVLGGENHLVDYTVRKFTIQQVRGDATLSMRRNLMHYHFTSWPDFGVPKTPSGMLKFLRKIKQGSPTGYGAIVVHCSAGVGRTGTFICIDAMVDMMLRENKVDVYGFVSQMRSQRPEMVQTEQQYIFIYQAVLEHHLYGDTEVEATEMSSHIDDLNQRLPGNVTGMEHEFKKLTTIRIQKDQMRAGNHPANMRKNRVLLILPYDWNRVILPVKRGVENSDYINASYIDGYRQKDVYIATQGPLSHTVEDFWRLIWESKSASIVMLTELVERGQAKCEQYWPDNGVMTYGDLNVDNISENELDNYTTRDFVLTSANDPGDRKQMVRQFHYHGWPESGPPVSGFSMITLVEQVQKQQQTSGNHPITIHCSAGAGRTGAFCALSTALEQVKAEGVLDMFQIVKCLRMQRPHMVQNLEQYEFCYRAVQEYIDSMSEYYNFK